MSLRTLRILIPLAIAAAGPARATTLGEDSELDRLYVQARAIMDAPADGDDLQRALGLLQAALNKDGEFAPAYVELARYVLKVSSTGSSGPWDYFADGAPERALQLLDQAASLEPDFADTFVLAGYVATAMDRQSLGLIALDEAERLGSDSLWLLLNRAQAEEQLGDFPSARGTYLEVRERIPQGDNQRLTILESLVRVAEQPEEIDYYYLELLRALPRSAWVRAAYADFLLREGRIDESIEYARAALDFGSGNQNRWTLAAAFYARAASLAEVGQTADADALILEATVLGFPPETALFDLAWWHSTRPAVLMLIGRGTDPDLRDSMGDTVLFRFLTEGSSAEVAALLASGADPNVRNRTGLTPLHVAIQAGSHDLVRLLLEAGADPNAPRYDNKRPTEIARDAGDRELVALLERSGAAASGPPVAEIVAGVRAGGAAQIDRAIKYLQYEDPDDTAVLEALQHAIVTDPARILPLTNGLAGVRTRICGHAATDSSPSIERRLEAVLGAFGPQPDRQRDLTMCRAALEHAQTVPAERPLPAKPNARQRRELRTDAAMLLDQTHGPDSRLSRAETILRRLTITAPDDAASQYLSARAQLIGAETKTADESDSRYSADRLGQVVYYLEAALRADPDYAEAIGLYGHVLVNEGYVGLGSAVVDRAAALDDSEWIEFFEADRDTAAGNFASARNALETLFDSATERRLRRSAGFVLAGGFRAEGDDAAVRSTFDRLIALDRNDVAIFAAYTRYLLYDREDYEQAALIGRRINELGSYAADGALYMQALLADASGRLLAGDVGEAADLFRMGFRLGRDPRKIVLGAARHSATQKTLWGLYAAGLDVDVADDDGNTPLFFAVMLGDEASARRLLSSGADVNARNGEDLTPFQLAVAMRQEQIAIMLLAAGARDYWSLPDGSSLIDLAYTLGLTRLYDLLEDARSKRFPGWDEFIEGVRSAQPVHLARALSLTAQPEVASALQTAMIRFPRTVTHFAALAGALDEVCAADTSGRDDSAETLAAVERVRMIQADIGIAAPDETLDACSEALATSGPSLAASPSQMRPQSG